MTDILREDLLQLKDKIGKIESTLGDKMKSLEEREEKWRKLDEESAKVRKYQNEIVKMNVGGKEFQTKTDTLLSIEDTLFYKVVLSKKFDLQKEIFFDRSPKMFGFILDYLRYHKLHYERFNSEEQRELLVEAEYYEVEPIAGYLRENLKLIKFVDFEFSGPYFHMNTQVGTNKLEDLTVRDLSTGICTNNAGYITIELNNDWEFEEIEIGGFSGHPNYWYSGNGINARIETSINEVNWKYVGVIPGNYATIPISVPLTRSLARYIRFSNNSFLGIGYLNIKKLK